MLLRSRKVIAIILILTMFSIVLMIGTVTYKPAIQHATYDEIIDIDGFGPVLTLRVESYLLENPEATLEDLDSIPGIGPKRIKLLKKEWK